LTSLNYEGWIIPADQISARYLNPRLRYYYFRLLKTNGRINWNSTSVSILALRHYRHVILHLPIKFHPNRTIRSSCDAISIFHDGGHGMTSLTAVFPQLTWSYDNSRGKETTSPKSWTNTIGPHVLWSWGIGITGPQCLRLFNDLTFLIYLKMQYYHHHHHQKF